ncbi:MAG: hypothetical protein IBJ11_05125 [Phycisphaerales bacterium]|nr:hypothetical protein [Phycisphaerales bacterium]
MKRWMIVLAAVLTGLLPVGRAGAWDSHGHRLITLLALDGLPAELPAYLRDEQTRLQIAYQAPEPDRWRSQPSLPMLHVSNPNHYLDLEDLEPFGLTLDTIPPLRHEYVRAMERARLAHPEKFPPLPPETKDDDKTKEYPGFLPHAIAEHWGLLAAGFRTLRVLEAADADVSSADARAARGAQVAQARANVVYQMGVLSHYVGDAAQPLHTTTHHHGWVGENPGQYTTNRGFHAYIDGEILAIHRIDYALLKARMKHDRSASAGDPWKDITAHIRRSFDLVEPLYRMEKDGTLVQEAGKEFISLRLLDAAETLGALYRSAWQASEPSDRDVQMFLRYTPPDNVPIWEWRPRTRPPQAR